MAMAITTGRVSKLTLQSQRGRERRHETCKTLMKSCSTNRNFRTLHWNHWVHQLWLWSIIINYHHLSSLLDNYPNISKPFAYLVAGPLSSSYAECCHWYMVWLVRLVRRSPEGGCCCRHWGDGGSVETPRVASNTLTPLTTWQRRKTLLQDTARHNGARWSKYFDNQAVWPKIIKILRWKWK